MSTGDPTPRGRLLDIDDEECHQWLDLLFLNVVRMARLITPHLIGGEGRAWVAIGSTDHRDPDPSTPHSSTIRNAVAAFTKLYAQTYAPDASR